MNVIPGGFVTTVSHSISLYQSGAETPDKTSSPKCLWMYVVHVWSFIRTLHLTPIHRKRWLQTPSNIPLWILQALRSFWAKHLCVCPDSQSKYCMLYPFWNLCFYSSFLATGQVFDILFFPEWSMPLVFLLGGFGLVFNRILGSTPRIEYFAIGRRK